MTLAACSQSMPAERVFAVCAPISIGGDRPAAVDEAIALWTAVGVALERTDAPEISVAFAAGGPAEFGFYADGHVTINEELDDDQAAIVIAHELGHAFGLVHTTARLSVMNPGNLAIAPTPDDRAAIAPCD